MQTFLIEVCSTASIAIVAITKDLPVPVGIIQICLSCVARLAKAYRAIACYKAVGLILEISKTDR